MCVPSSCSDEEVQAEILRPIALSSFSDAYLNAFVVFGCNSDDDSPDLDAGDIAYMYGTVGLRHRDAYRKKMVGNSSAKSHEQIEKKK